MTKRKLASIRRISAIRSIPNADKIEAAQIDGWQVVTGKGDFKVNDLCVFFETDAFLPDTHMYNFLPKLTIYQGVFGYRIKTIKLRKTLSQGLALPLSAFAKLRDWVDSEPFNEGDDVTELLGIIKYDTEVVNSTNSHKVNTLLPFPPFIPKTDQERIQNLPHLFELYQDAVFEETLKLNGTSMTAYKVSIELPAYKKFINRFIKLFPTEHFGVCSRNHELQSEDNSIYWRAAEVYQLKHLRFHNLAIQGELVGPKIQDNYEKRHHLEFYVFSIFDISTQTYLLPEEVHNFCDEYSLDHVPLVNSAVKPLSKTLDHLLDQVNGSSIDPDIISEGRVYKHLNSDLSFKVLNNIYLLKEK